MNELINILSVQNKRVIITSLDVANVFKKKHKDILRAIRNLETSESFNRLNFAPVEFVDSKGEKRPMFQITRNGFAMLAMGFTGKEAAEFKERLLAAFDKMEEALRENRLGLTTEDLPSLLAQKKEMEISKAEYDKEFKLKFESIEGKINKIELENAVKRLSPVGTKAALDYIKKNLSYPVKISDDNPELPE